MSYSRCMALTFAALEEAELLSLWTIEPKKLAGLRKDYDVLLAARQQYTLCLDKVSEKPDDVEKHLDQVKQAADALLKATG